MFATLSSAALLLGIFLILLSLFLFFKLNIYEVQSELSGRSDKKKIKKLSKQYRVHKGESPSTGSFYNNSMSSFSNTTTSTFAGTGELVSTGAFNSRAGSVSVGGAPTQEPTPLVTLEDLGGFDQEEFHTGVFDEEPEGIADYTNENTSSFNKYSSLVILEENTNIILKD